MYRLPVLVKGSSAVSARYLDGYTLRGMVVTDDGNFFYVTNEDDYESEDEL